MAGFSSIIGGCRNIYCDSPLLGGYKPLLLGQRLKALAFILGYGKFDFPQLHSSHIAFDSSLPHKGVVVLLHVNP